MSPGRGKQGSQHFPLGGVGNHPFAPLTRLNLMIQENSSYMRVDVGGRQHVAVG